MYAPERLNLHHELINLPLKVFLEIGFTVPNPVVSNGIFFSKDEDHYLVAYNEVDGSILWKSEVNDLWISLPLIIGNKILERDLYTESGVILSSKDGSVIKNLDRIRGAQWVYKNGSIYLWIYDEGDAAQIKLCCFDASEYTSNWTYAGFQFDYYAVSNDYILLKDDHGNLAALNLNGKELWQLSPLDTGLFDNQGEIDNLPKSKPGFSNLNRTLGYPNIYQNRIGIAPMLNNHLVGIDLATGTVLWTRTLMSSQNWIRQGYCDEVYCLSHSHIEAFSLETGEQTKKIAIDGSYITETLGKETISFTQFAVSETHIFAASSIMHYFSAINIDTGKVEWAFQPEYAIANDSQPYVANGRVYYPCLSKMYIFEGQNGYVPAT